MKRLPVHLLSCLLLLGAAPAFAGPVVIVSPSNGPAKFGAPPAVSGTPAVIDQFAAAMAGNAAENRAGSDAAQAQRAIVTQQAVTAHGTYVQDLIDQSANIEADRVKPKPKPMPTVLPSDVSLAPYPYW